MAEVLTATITAVPVSAPQPALLISRRATLETADLHCGGLEAHERNAQAPSFCRSASPRPSNGLTFARRRHSKSLDSPYLSRPRMKRRGAVSYDKKDAAAEYIRYLGSLTCGNCSPVLETSLFTGDTLDQHRHVQTRSALAELPANKCKQFCERTSFRCMPESCGHTRLSVYTANSSTPWLAPVCAKPSTGDSSICVCVLVGSVG